MWEVGGHCPGVKAAEPEVISPLAKAPGVPAGGRGQGVGSPTEDPVVVECRDEVIPCQAGVSLGGAVIYVWRPVRWGTSASQRHPSSVSWGGRASRVPSTTASHSTFSPSQQSSSRRSAAARWVGSMRKRHHSEPGALVLPGEPSDGGRSAPPCVHLRGLEHVGGVEHKAGGEGCSDERGHIATPPRLGLWGRPQPFRGRRVPLRII